MKKVSFILTIVLAITLWGCRNYDAVTFPEYDLILTAPDDGLAVDLALNPTVNFSYNEVPGVKTYVLELSRSETMDPDITNIQSMFVTANPHPLTTAELDVIASTLGVRKDGTSATLYWTIRPNSGAANIHTQVRSFQLVRALTPLQYPIDGEEHIILNHPGIDSTLTFEWANRDNAQAELIVGTTANLSDGITLFTGAAFSATFTHADLQSRLIEHATLGLSKYYKNKLYWNVKIGGKFIGEANESFFLSGQRVLVDTRADGTMTYVVAVIEENGYTAVWMGQDLKTKYMYDGSEVPGIAYFPPPAGDPVYGGALRTVVAPGDNPHQGYVYQAIWGTFLAGYGAYDLTDPNFVPAGWTVPTQSDMEELFEAAHTLTGGDDVLRCPIAHGDPYFGKWGLNFYENGCIDGSTYVYSSISGMYYVAIGPDGCTYGYYGYGSQWTGIFWRNGVVRFKYIGK
jgi:hypothetical protein